MVDARAKNHARPRQRSFFCPAAPVMGRNFLIPLVAQCEIPPHIAQYLFEIASQRGSRTHFALFSCSIAQVSLRYPLWGGGGVSHLTFSCSQRGKGSEKGEGVSHRSADVGCRELRCEIWKLQKGDKSNCCLHLWELWMSHLKYLFHFLMRCAKGIFAKGILVCTGFSLLWWEKGSKTPFSPSQEGVSDPFSHRKRENPVHPKIPLAKTPLAQRMTFADRSATTQAQQRCCIRFLFEVLLPWAGAGASFCGPEDDS